VTGAVQAYRAHGVDSGRRRFLRGRFWTPASSAIRPPWAAPEADFLAACTRCLVCAGACPGGIIVRGEGGYPEVSFGTGECTFCGACVAACAPGALSNVRSAWRLQPVVASACFTRRGVLCRSCADSCEHATIRIQQGPAGPTVQVTGAACTGCGACVHACPMSAITMEGARE